MAAGERRLRILLRLSEPSARLDPTRLGRVCAEVVGVDGAGIMLMAGDVNTASMGATDSIADRIEDLQYTLGEGPCLDAYRHDRPVLEADLADPVTRRWPVFAPGVVAVGVRAIFGFPVRVGAARLGALNLYRRRPGALSDDQHADALVMADVVGEVLLGLQAGVLPDQLIADLKANANLHVAVAQASGMVAVQLDVPVSEALVRLRGYAFAQDRLVDDVAAEVIDRRLRFNPHPDPPNI